MRFIIALIVGLIHFTPAVANECSSPVLSSEVLELVKPLVKLRIMQSDEQFTKDGRWRGESQYTPEVNERFYTLLNNKSAQGDEALVYLLNVYMGSHPGEELVCEISNRGKRMVTLIAAYKNCTPSIGLEPLPKFVKGSGILFKYAEENLSNGKKCEHI